jgi:hypothetical protein
MIDKSRISSTPPPLNLTEQQQQQILQSITTPLPARIESQDCVYISQVGYFSSVAAISVFYRILNSNGTISSGTWQTTTRLNDALEKVDIIQPTLDGSIISLGVKVSSTALCYVQVGLHRGITAASGGRLNTMIAGYITSSCGLSFPDDIPITALQGIGNIRYIGQYNGALPYTLTPPAGTRWRNPLFYITYVTDATAADRYVRLEMRSGAIICSAFCSIVAQAASLTYIYQFGSFPGSTAVFGSSGSALYVNVQLPNNLVTPSGGVFIFSPINRQATDAMTIQVYAEEVADI